MAIRNNIGLKTETWITTVQTGFFRRKVSEENSHRVIYQEGRYPCQTGKEMANASSLSINYLLLTTSKAFDKSRKPCQHHVWHQLEMRSPLTCRFMNVDMGALA